MKKQFTTFLSFAVTTVMAFTLMAGLTSCSSDITEENGQNQGKQTAQTVFSMESDEATRTSMKNNLHFFWEKGDKIWVYNGSAWVKSDQSDITATAAQAKFIVEGNFISEPVKVVYTGYTNNDTTATSATKVTIADQQTQKVWNDGTHLSVSGDCATGMAYKKPGGYKFTLDHQASYLLIYPYLASTLSGNYTLQKIQITTTSTSEAPLAGEYDFTHDGGLPEAPIAGTEKQTITLNCGTDGFLLNRTIPDPTKVTSPDNHCFVVIAPGTRAISIEYFVTAAANPSETITFIKDIATKDYIPNGVYTFVHELRDVTVIYEDFQYDAAQYRWGSVTDGGSFDPSTSQVTTGHWATVPNYATVTEYYLPNGDIRWDNAAKYRYYNAAGSAGIYRAGWWVKKKQYITRAPGTSVYYVKNGRPAESELSKYFFIPALSQKRTSMTLWTSTPYDASVAYYVDFAPYSVSIRMSSKNVAGAMVSKTFRRDGTPWFK